MSKRRYKKMMIRNSTVEFITFTSQTGKDPIEVWYEHGTIWLTQKLMAQLFGVETHTINYHIKEIFKSGELQQKAVIRIFRITVSDKKEYNTLLYNLINVCGLSQ